MNTSGVGRWIRRGRTIVLLDAFPANRSVSEADDEVLDEIIPYGCSPCIWGWQVCHKPIAPEPPRCYWIGDEYYRCRC